MDDTAALKLHVLQRLAQGSVWGGKHIPLSFVQNGLPSAYRSNRKGKKMLEKVLKELLNAGWLFIVAKRTGKSSEEHVSLNQRMVGEVYRYIEEKTKNEV